MLKAKVRLVCLYLPENPGAGSDFVQCSAARNGYQVRWIVKWKTARGAEDSGGKVTAADAEEEPGVRLSDSSGEDGALTAGPPGEDPVPPSASGDAEQTGRSALSVVLSLGMRRPGSYKAFSESKLNNHCFLPTLRNRVMRWQWINLKKMSTSEALCNATIFCDCVVMPTLWISWSLAMSLSLGSRAVSRTEMMLLLPHPSPLPGLIQ